MRAMMSTPPQQPTAADLATMAQWGLCAEHLAQPSREPVGIWPDHVTPLRLFDALLTQWRMGAGGPVGLDYLALPVVARMLHVGRRALREAFDALRVCESEALAVIMERQRAMEQRR